MRSRAVTMHDIAARMLGEKAAYAEALTREEGKPFKESVDEVSWCVTAMDYYAEIARHEAGRIAETTVPGQFLFRIKEPFATVVTVLPLKVRYVRTCRASGARLVGGPCRRSIGSEQV